MFHFIKPAMTTQNYFGLDNDEGKSWNLVQYLEGKIILLQRFGDSVDGLNSLEKFIRDRSGRPRICVKLSNDSTLKLLAYLSGIPDVEVIFVSEAGFSQYQTWLPKHHSAPFSHNAFRAEMLAQCAERMI